MKKIILATLVLIFSCISSISAQTYTPIEFGNTRWMYNIENFTYSKSYCYFSKDTLGYYYGGNKYWRIEYMVSPTYTPTNQANFVCDDTNARKIFKIDTSTNTTYLLCDFSVNTGDTVNTVYNWPMTDTVLVDTVKYIIINGVLRKHVYVHSIIQNQPIRVWIEGIGSKYEFFRPTLGPTDPDYRLICQEFNSFINYGDSIACSNFLTSIPKSPSQTDKFSVVYNPISTSINIANHSSITYTFSLFDISGRLLQRTTLNSLQENISLNSYSNAMLIFQIVTNKNEIQTGKIVLH